MLQRIGWDHEHAPSAYPDRDSHGGGGGGGGETGVHLKALQILGEAGVWGVEHGGVRRMDEEEEGVVRGGRIYLDGCVWSVWQMGVWRWVVDEGGGEGGACIRQSPIIPPPLRQPASGHR